MLGPIENITREKFVGIDISDFSLEAVVLVKRGRKKYKVLSYSRFRLSPGIIEDGYITNPEKFQEAITKLFSLGKPYAITTNNVFLSIPESKVFSRILSLPKSLRNKDLSATVRQKAEEFIPESPDNLIADYKILSNDKEKSEIFYAGARKETIEDFVKVFENMNMDIIGVTISSMAAFMGLADELKQQDTLLLDLGARQTVAAIFDKQGIRDSIIIPIAGDHINDALVSHLNISHTEAEEKKRQFGMDSSVAQGEVMLVIQGQMQPVADELKKFIHYHEESTGRKLTQLVLTGGTAKIKGLDKYFGDNLNLPATLAYSFVQEKYLTETDSYTKYINALGLAKLALQKKWDINFYQTPRVDLQQNVTAENFVTWLKLLGRLFLNIPQLFRRIFSRWYYIVVLVLIILAIVGWAYQAKFAGTIAYNNKVLSKQIIVSAKSQLVDNYIAGQLINYPFNYQEAYPDLTYQVAVKELKKTASLAAEAESASLADANRSIIPQIVAVADIQISPIKAEGYILTIDDILSISANFGFLAIDNQSVRGLLLSDLPSAEAEKLNTWLISSINNKVVDFDPQDGLFTINTTLEVIKPLGDNKWYWPF